MLVWPEAIRLCKAIEEKLPDYLSGENPAMESPHLLMMTSDNHSKNFLDFGEQAFLNLTEGLWFFKDVAS